MNKFATHRLSFLAETAICFVLLTLVLVWRHGMSSELPDTWLMRAGMLRDLAAELPIGRQALVCSPALMPLPGVAALPFLPFLPPAGYGYAYLYGLAALLAMAVVPLRSLLRQCGAERLSGAAPLLLALAAATLGATPHSDLLACLAMLILALYFEGRDLAELRALAGVFWGLVLFAHVAGLALVALRMVVAGVCMARESRALGPGRAGATEAQAVRWIQGVSVAYLLIVYLFLNWMIMGAVRYPVEAAARLCKLERTEAPSESLAAALKRLCPDRTPVVSGHWGYLIQPLLQETKGYHFIDFHPAKLPAWDSRPLVLVVPAPGNPLARLCDQQPENPGLRPGRVSYLRLAQTPDWRFFLFEQR
ncbi:MAG: hypothetical protein ACOYOU_16105 [Kiritimatiellia bacterium]